MTEQRDVTLTKRTKVNGVWQPAGRTITVPEGIARWLEEQGHAEAPSSGVTGAPVQRRVIKACCGRTSR